MAHRHPIVEVKPGQIWADNDWRSAGRIVRIESVDETHATCTIVANPTSVQAELDKYGKVWRVDMRGKTTRIQLARFKPTSTGYRLLEDA